MNPQGFRRILLATDGSAHAAAAEAVARSFAHASSAAVRVVHVWNLEAHQKGKAWDVEMVTEADNLIDDTTARLRAAGVTTDGTIRRADSEHVAVAVAQAARDFGADLVVVGSRGLSDWQSMRRHSVSHQLLTALDCPLMIVRDLPGEHLSDAKRIVLAIAGGDDVEPGARAAVAAASAPGAQVLVLHVAQAVIGIQGVAYVEPEEDIAATLRRATAILEEAGIPTESRVAVAGPVARTVADLAAGWKADVIVIGSSRMGDLGSLLLGSVTHDLLKVAAQPVLVAERIR